MVITTTAIFPTMNIDGYDFTTTSGDFSIGSMTVFFDNGQYNCAALPVTLTSWNVQARQVNGLYQINFTWQTGSEANSCYYSIEQYIDGSFKGGICKVPAAGQSSSTKNYSYDYLYPSPGNFQQFRLKMVDQDGAVKYSLIKTVNINNCSGCFRTPRSCNISIIGPATVCSGAGNYTLTSLNTNDITWSLSSTGSFFGNCDNSATVSANGSGSEILTANVSGCTNPISKTITMGAGNANFSHTLWPDGYLAAYAELVPGATYQWELNLGTNGTYYEAGSNVSFQLPPCSGGALRLYVTTSCGTVSNGVTVWRNCNEYYYMAAPTQTSDNVKIKARPKDATPNAKGGNEELPFIKEIIVYDNYRNIKLRKTYAAKTNYVDLNVSTLAPGNYLVEIKTEKGREVHRIQVIR